MLMMTPARARDFMMVWAACGAIAALLAPSAAAGSMAPHGLHINHEGSEALAVAPGMSLGWALPPHAEQAASFWVRLVSLYDGSSMGEFECGAVSSKSLNCSMSDSIPLEAMTGFPLPPSTSFAVQVPPAPSTAPPPAPPAEPPALCLPQVQLVTTSQERGAWSAPYRFATALRAQVPDASCWSGRCTSTWPFP